MSEPTPHHESWLSRLIGWITLRAARERNRSRSASVRENIDRIHRELEEQRRYGPASQYRPRSS
jgi:hypothetical protein